MPIQLLDQGTEEQHPILYTRQAQCWLKWQGGLAEAGEVTLMPGFEDEQPGRWAIFLRSEPQSEREEWAGKYRECTRALTVPTLVSNDAACGSIIVGGSVMFDTSADPGGIVVLAAGGVARSPMFESNNVFGDGLGISEDLAQPPLDRCRQVLSSFASYATEILRRKGIETTDTKIRDWQAIDDASWKQCILSLTVRATSDVALLVWDELAAELQKFIATQPKDARLLLESSLSLDVGWI